MSGDTLHRAQLSLRDLNARFLNDWDRYANHRRHTHALIPVLSGEPDICVFGAGNCSDIDLQELSRTFREIHLVDLDGSALERARQRQPAALRKRIVLHQGVDLSGCLVHIDEWGESFPDPAQLGGIAVAAARNIVARVGRPFDVTVSCCVLSQLVTPFHRTWALPSSSWANLVAILRAIHLATLAGSTRSGGKGIVTFDVMSSTSEPALATLLGQDAGALSSFFASRIATTPDAPDPDPEALLGQFRQGLGGLVASSQLVPPWLWDINGAQQLVFGLVFERA